MSVFLITGANQGLGRTLCEYFAEKGNQVIGVARNEAKLKQTTENIKSSGYKMSYYAVDISNYKSIGSVVNKISERWKNIDVLINNAGIGNYSRFENLEQNEIDSVLDTNLKGLIYVTRHVVVNMIKQRSGNIINISSMAGVREFNGNGIYCASKFGVNGFTFALSKYLMEYDIHVNAICPGGIDTPWWQNQDRKWKHDKKTLINPIEIAETINFILSLPRTTHLKNILFYPTSEINDM